MYWELYKIENKKMYHMEQRAEKELEQNMLAYKANLIFVTNELWVNKIFPCYQAKRR